MNSDEIIRMAEESGLANILSDWSHEFTLDLWPTNEIPELERFAALVAAAEREAVGNIILDYAGRDDLSDSDESLLKHLFELIRARGET